MEIKCLSYLDQGIFKFQRSCSVLKWILVMPQCRRSVTTELSQALQGSVHSVGLPSLWSRVHWSWGSIPTSLSVCVSMVYFVDLVFPDINKSLLCMSLKYFSKASALKWCQISLSGRGSLQRRHELLGHVGYWELCSHEDAACRIHSKQEQLCIWAAWGGSMTGIELRGMSRSTCKYLT